MERFHVDVGDGVRLHATRLGEGPPLVLLHGFTGSTESWAPVRAALAGRFTTIAVDLPGHGRSTSPADPARYALARFAGDLARVLDALGIERTVLLGYSLGGRAALRFALERPERLVALVLESASPGIAKPAERAARLVADGVLADEIERDGITAFVDRWERLPLWTSQASSRRAAAVFAVRLVRRRRITRSRRPAIERAWPTDPGGRNASNATRISARGPTTEISAAPGPPPARARLASDPTRP